MTSPHAVHWSADYIGAPWSARGRDHSGLDCWGLVRLVYLERLGRDLPDFEGYVSGHEKRDIDALIAGERAKGDWREVDQAEPFDIAVFRTGKLATHLGVMIDARRMLHVADGRDAEISRIDTGTWSTRLIGVFRLI